MIPIETLLRGGITSDQLFDVMLGALERIKIPARSWREGGVGRSIVAVAAEVGAQGAAVLSSLIGGMFLLFGKGDYLTDHAKDVYDVDRISATFATGKVTLTNRGGAIYTIAADTLVVFSSNDENRRFRISEAFVLGSGSESSPTSVTVAVTAITSGASSSVSPTEIDSLETPLARVTVNNDASIIGRDEESDDQLVKRCIVKKGTWSPFGPRDAYEYAALSALLLDGTPTSITRVAVTRYSSTSEVGVVCATPSGTPSTAELDAVRANIERIARTDTAKVTVSGAVQRSTAHSIVLWARRGTEAVLRANAQKSLSDLIANWPIGGIAKSDGGQGYLYSDVVGSVVIASSPEAFDVDFVPGPVDWTLAPNEVAINTATFDIRIRT